MTYLEQSTVVTVKIGAFVDGTDGFTPETSLTISQADIRLSKNGGNFAQSNDASGATHDENGYYDIPLNTTDTNTLGILKLAVTESGSRPVNAEFMVIASEAYELITGVSNVQNLVWDEVLTGGTHNVPSSSGRRLRTLQEFQGYESGSIWVDTNNGTAGTVDYENGTVENPVLTWADALTISGSLGLSSFRIINGSSITLTASISNFSINGINYTLNLNSQIITGASIVGANVSGVGLNGGANPTFTRCLFGTVSIPGTTASQCGLTGTLTLTEATDYFFDQCYSGVAGTNAPILDFVSAIGTTNVNFRHYSGGIDIRNMGQSGTDTMSLEGWGQFILNANCIGGTLAPRGHFKKTDNSGGAVGISEDANFKTSVIHTGTAQGSGTGSNQIQLASTASTTDGAYDPSMIVIVTGTGVGQSRLIYQYDGSTRTATVDRNWKINPDTTSEYRVLAHPGREHVNEGLAQAGSTNTITLNTLASSFDDAYNGQVVFLRSGTGEDQVRQISGYTGLTKVLVVEHDWDVIPDSTTGYVILPEHVHSIEHIADEVLDRALTEPTDISNKSLHGIVWHLFSRAYHKVTQTSTTQTVFKSDSSTSLGSMVTSDDGTTQTKGKAT